MALKIDPTLSVRLDLDRSSPEFYLGVEAAVVDEIVRLEAGSADWRMMRDLLGDCLYVCPVLKLVVVLIGLV